MTLYKDDGENLDLVASDWLYTAVVLRKFSKDVPYVHSVEFRSLLEKPVVPEDFLCEVE